MKIRIEKENIINYFFLFKKNTVKQSQTHWIQRESSRYHFEPQFEAQV